MTKTITKKSTDANLRPRVLAHFVFSYQFFFFFVGKYIKTHFDVLY